MDFVKGLVVGVASGVSWSVSGYWKSKQDEYFDWVKFGRSVVVGAVCGVAFEMFGVPMDATYQYLATVGLTAGVENVLKGVKRWIEEKFFW